MDVFFCWGMAVTGTYDRYKMLTVSLLKRLRNGRFTSETEGARRMRLLPGHLLCTPNTPAAVVPSIHAECACGRGTFYARRMRLLPWRLLYTPNAPAAVAPAMHAECACCRGTCYAHRMRLLPWHLQCTPNAPATCASSPRVSPSAQMPSESRTKRIPIFLFAFMTNRNTHPLFVQHFCHSMAEKAFAFLLLSLPLAPLLPTQYNSYHVLYDYGAVLVRVVATVRLSIWPRP
jgi:hypothetical protein